MSESGRGLLRPPHSRMIKQGVEKISGLTTAATIWVAGALGAAAGMGSYGLVILVAVLTTLALILGRFEH